MNFVRIEGYPDYVIHPCGTILRIWPHKTKERKPNKQNNGYMRIELSKNGKKKKFLVHRLLAIAFIPNPENKPCVNHIRGKHIGNSLDNLEWATYAENRNGFTINPIKIITKGAIRKTKYGWEWRYCMSAVNKSKTMKSLEDLETYRNETLEKYLN